MKVNANEVVSPAKRNLLDLSIEELEVEFEKIGQQKFRAKQIFQWCHKGINDIEEMTNLSKDLRQNLKDIFFIGKHKIKQKLVSKIDGTTKYLFELIDGNVIESVLMIYEHGLTVCISSQVGCKMGCKFCASTHVGYERNLTPGEMLDQILTIQADAGKRVGNIVIMGIGEPLDNYDNLIKFLRLVNHPEGLNIGYRHISVSTCGLVPNILRLAEENMHVTLSISLHAPNDEIREKIMPINRKHSIDKILEACKIYTEITKRRITYEYALISGVNDSRENSAELAHRIKGTLCHVNLIPINAIEDVDFKKSDRKQISVFKVILERYGIETTVRRELGSDINAACGQLRRSTITKG
jgi:23S rRNA (adenine2503-C2)-methyltransferase